MVAGGAGRCRRDATARIADLVDVRSVRTQLSRSLLTVPIAILAIVVLLGLLKVNGSSAAVLSTEPSAELAGQAHLIRTDEYLVRTPLVIHQAELDFPAESQVGMGSHDMGVLSDLPVKDLSVVVRPHSWVYFVVDVERAFAFEWWIVVLGPFFGVYAVVAVLTRRTLLASLAGLLATASPAMLWFAVPGMGLAVLYGGLTSAALLLSVTSEGRRRYIFAALAGWLAVAFAALLYIPWLIPLAMIFGAILIVQLPAAIKTWPAFIRVAAVFFGVVVVFFAIYYRDHHNALRVIAASRYPGERVTKPGEAIPAHLFGSPYDVFATARPLTTINGTNESQNASGLMLWLPIALVGGAFTGWRARSQAQRALVAVMTVAMVLAAWALLPVPVSIARLIGLTNVQGPRVAMPLTVAGAIAAALYLHRLREDPAFRPRRDRIIIATLAFAFVTGWAGTQITLEGVPVARGKIVLLWLVVTLVVTLLLRGKVLLGLGGLCVFVLFGSVRINPLQVGLDPILDHPLVAQVDAVAAQHEGERWAAIGADTGMRALVVASGVPTVTGTSWYADTGAWDAIDPTEASRDLWDRYANIGMEVDLTLPAVTYQLVADDFLMVLTPPCSGALQQLDVRFAAVDHEVAASCFNLLDAPDQLGERWIYAVGTG